MHFVVKLLLSLLKGGAILCAVAALAGLVVTLSRDSDQKRYLLDVGIDEADE